MMTTLVSPTRPDMPQRAYAKRPPSLADRFYDLLALSTRDLDRALERFVAGEQELAEPERYEAVRDRLCAWLDLDDEDARILAAAFERASAAFPTEYRARRVEAERAVIMNALSFQDFVRLSSILPWLRDEPVAGVAVPTAAAGR
jgi:hypothetical protein